jgi:antitoxin PrlF
MAVLSSPDAAGASAATLQSEVESALTERYQTTVPQPVRRALGLRKRGRIRYSFRANGEVVLQVQQKKLLKVANQLRNPIGYQKT